jgi:ubiquitin-protein ligase
VIEVTGAAGTLYAGETYQLQVDFPEHYPMEAPQVRFSQQRLHIQFMIISSIVLCSLHLIGR